MSDPQKGQYLVLSREREGWTTAGVPVTTEGEADEQSRQIFMSNMSTHRSDTIIVQVIDTRIRDFDKR